jgi:hypothetical protein
LISIDADTILLENKLILINQQSCNLFVTRSAMRGTITSLPMANHEETQDKN